MTVSFFISRDKVLGEELEDEMSLKILEKFLWVKKSLLNEIEIWIMASLESRSSLIQRSRAGNVLKLCLYQHRPLWATGHVFSLNHVIIISCDHVTTPSQRVKCRFTVKLVIFKKILRYFPEIAFPNPKLCWIWVWYP